MIKTEPFFLQNKEWIIKPKKFIFDWVFILVFCLSGFLSIISIMLGFIDYRMGLVSLFIIPLILIYGIKINYLVFVCFLLTLEVVISGIYNQSSLVEVMTFLRIVLFAFLVYRLVDLYITSSTVSRVIKGMIVIGQLQLPVIILQKYFYYQLPNLIKNNVSSIDFDFGTFNFKCDSSMGFFLLLLIIFLLFEKKRSYFIHNKWPTLIYFSFTILIINSNMILLLLILTWILFLIKNIIYIRFKYILIFIVVLILFIGFLQISGSLNDVMLRLNHSIVSNTTASKSSTAQYFSGGYGRGAALKYYFSNKVLWLGNGPSKYFDAFERILYLGNYGHFFTFYSEIGIIGWVLSVWIFFIICFPKINGKRIFTWGRVLSFIAIQALGFTTQILNDISIMLAYCIIAKIHLIPALEKN